MPTPNNPFDYEPLNDPQIAMVLAQLSQRGMAQRDAASNAANAPRQPDTRDRNPFAGMNAMSAEREKVKRDRMQTQRMGVGLEADALKLDSVNMANQRQQMDLARNRSMGSSAQGVLDFQNRARVESGRARGQAQGEMERMQRQARGAPGDRIEDTYANAFLDRLLGAGGSMTTQRQVPGYEMDTGMRGPDGEVLMQRVPGRTEEVTEQIVPRGLGDTGGLPENLRAAFEPEYQNPQQRRLGGLGESLVAGAEGKALDDMSIEEVAALYGVEMARAIAEGRTQRRRIEAMDPAGPQGQATAAARKAQEQESGRGQRVSQVTSEGASAAERFGAGLDDFTAAPNHIDKFIDDIAATISSANLRPEEIERAIDLFESNALDGARRDNIGLAFEDDEYEVAAISRAFQILRQRLGVGGRGGGAKTLDQIGFGSLNDPNRRVLGTEGANPLRFF